MEKLLKEFGRVGDNLDEKLYNLFCILDGEEAIKRFSECWPVLDKKREVKFRAECLRWLSELKKQGWIKESVPVRKSVFDQVTGDVVNQVLEGLACAVLRIRLKLKPDEVVENGFVDLEKELKEIESIELNSKIDVFGEGLSENLIKLNGILRFDLNLLLPSLRIQQKIIELEALVQNLEKQRLEMDRENQDNVIKIIKNDF